MKLSDWKNQLLRKFSRREEDATRRPDGGTSCYRPLKKKAQAAEPAREEDNRQPMAYVHTGFTGMNPPADGYSTAYMPYAGQTGYAPSAGYGQGGYGAQPGIQPGGYEAPNAYGQQPAYATQYGMQAQGAYNTQAAYSTQAAYPQTETQAARPERGWFPPREETAPRNNISYMPGYAPDKGSAPFNHVEHIMTLTGLKSCYEAIECMKNGETLIVTLDAIANESESIRCQDMLAGAAFTLGCSVRMLQSARLVLIVPEGVRILPEETPVQAAPPVFAPVQTPAAEVPAHRERRGTHNPEWEAARNGSLKDYNPYTGTMPVAAGAYGSFGGYGY